MVSGRVTGFPVVFALGLYSQCIGLCRICDMVLRSLLFGFIGVAQGFHHPFLFGFCRRYTHPSQAPRHRFLKRVIIQNYLYYVDGSLM